MIGAVILGLVAGATARFLIPSDALERMGGLVSWLLTLVLGLVGAWLGWWIFTGLPGIGDETKFDLGGIIGALLGAVIVLGVVTWIVRRTSNQQRAPQRRLAVPVSHSRVPSRLPRRRAA